MLNSIGISRKFVKLLVTRIADGGVVCLDLEIPANTKALLGSLQNSDGALKLSASAMEFLPQLVENPCIKMSRYVTVFFIVIFLKV